MFDVEDRRGSVGYRPCSRERVTTQVCVTAWGSKSKDCVRSTHKGLHFGGTNPTKMRENPCRDVNRCLGGTFCFTTHRKGGDGPRPTKSDPTLRVSEPQTGETVGSTTSSVRSSVVVWGLKGPITRDLRALGSQVGPVPGVGLLRRLLLSSVCSEQVLYK